MPTIPHIERRFTTTDIVRDIVIDIGALSREWISKK